MQVGRRGVVGAALAVASMARASLAVAWPHAAAQATAVTGPVTLPDLPWKDSALDPVISAKTVGFHYGKHHRGYVMALNQQIIGTPFADMPLIEIVQKSEAGSVQFNNAAQCWNHDFYWQSLAPNAGGAPGADIGAMLNDGFGSYDAFAQQYVNAATAQFGSGWVWLAYERDNKKLVLLRTNNAETPITGRTHVPLAVLDVWEHAYYLDYQNRRKDHAQAVVAKLLNWRFVEKNLGQI